MECLLSKHDDHKLSFYQNGVYPFQPMSIIFFGFPTMFNDTVTVLNGCIVFGQQTMDQSDMLYLYFFNKHLYN